MKLVFIIKLLIMLFSLLNSQVLKNDLNKTNDFKLSNNLYISDQSGNFSMNINIWSDGKIGRILVPEGIDFITLLSMIGGPITINNYKKITIIREYPNKQNIKKVNVDLTQFLKTGDRDYLAKVLPNDTIIIKKKRTYDLLDQINRITTFITIISLIINLSSN
tara:strand:- start:188 stop:676 length:489 start_codon:yes stop_codon:yes gene_type:complete